MIIVRVDHEDDSMEAVVVLAPCESPPWIAETDVYRGDCQALCRNRLVVEPNRRYRCRYLPCTINESSVKRNDQ